MTVYLVARVSTYEQTDALPGQIHRLKAYADGKGYKYELIEIRESAYRDERANFGQFVKLVSSSTEPSIIVFDKIDRLTRRTDSGGVAILKKLCAIGQIEMHFPTDNLYITHESSAQQIFMLNVGASNSQYYSDSIRDGVNKGNAQKWRNGEWCGPAPIGYSNRVVDGKKWIVRDENTHELIKRTFELYASGIYSFRTIAQLWREEYGYERVGSSKIEHILSNPFYYGEMRVKGRLYKHRYEPIIDFTLFDKVQQVKRGYHVSPKKWGGLPFTYRSLIQCGECGCVITFEQKKGKYIYGHCTKKKNKHPFTYINETIIDDQIFSLLQSIQIPEPVVRSLSEDLRIEIDNDMTSYKKKQSLLSAEIRKYESHKNKVYDDYLDQRISEEFFESKFEELSKKIKLKRDQLQSLEPSNKDLLINATNLLNMTMDISRSFKKGDINQKRRLLKMIVSNLILDGPQLRWEYNNPFDIIANSIKTQNWYPLIVYFGTELTRILKSCIAF